MNPRLSAIALPLALLAVTSACKDPASATGDSDLPETEVCTEPEVVACEDDLILDLGMHDEVSPGRVTTTIDGEDYLTEVDATAGGFGQSANNPWVYVRFDATGATKLDITDEEALQSMEWHIAAKRFILRLNSGSSGPSCVAASPFLSTTYPELTAVPVGARFVEDDYYTSDCTLINDSSGLENSPQTALSPWWEYPGCVKTTGTPFLVRLDDGDVIKLAVEQYYATGQDTCNTASAPGTGGANFRWRWAFVD